MIVYVITEGEYSGYHIVGVTLDKDTANEFVKKHSSKCEWVSFMVEEYDTDTIQLIHDGMKMYRVWKRKGVLGIEECGNSSYAYSLVDINQVTRNKRDAWYCVNVLAKDKEHAEKQAVDLFTKYQYRYKIEEGE